MIRSKWRTLLKAATTEVEVLALVRTFAAAWTREEIAALPMGVWPSRIITPRDVTDAAVRASMAHAEFDGDTRALALLQEVLLFLTQASVRITYLAHLARSSGAKERQVATEPDEKIGGPVPAPTKARLDDLDG